MKHLHLTPSRARQILACALLGAMIASPAFAEDANTPSLPSPICLRADDCGDAKHAVNPQCSGQIGSLSFASDALPPDFVAPEPVGPNYTLAFWLRARPSPLLQSKEFSPEAPVTMADVSPLSDRGRQRLVLRVMNGCFMATEQNNGKWASLKGFDLKLVPERWYFVCYVRTPQSGILYVDGDRVLRTLSKSEGHAQFQRFAFGHFDRTRVFPGELLNPRVYNAALSDAQVQALLAQKPADAR